MDKNIKNYLLKSAKDYIIMLKNADNKRKIICSTLLQIQELTEHLKLYNLELNEIENAVENTSNKILIKNKK